MSEKLKNCFDYELVDKYVLEQNIKAFDELFYRHFDTTYRFVYSRVLSREMAEDITSEVFFTLIKVISSFDKKANFKSFVIGIALNKIRQSWRNNNLFFDNGINVEHLAENIEDQTDELEENALKELIKKILDRLPDKYKMILQSRYIENKSINDLSLELGISTNNLRVLQHRALKKALQIGKTLKNEQQ